MRAAVRYAWLGVLGCVHAPAGHAPKAPAVRVVAVEEPPPAASKEATEATDERARGVGAMTARVPGTTTTVDGAVRLIRHQVSVEIRDGLARTEIEEEFQSDAARVLEGRYVFDVRGRV